MKKLLSIFLLCAGLDNAQNIYTVAGSGSGGYAGDNASAVSAQIGLLEGPVAVDGQGNIFIPDWSNNRVRKVDITSGIITTVAGTGVSGYNGDGISATTAQIKSPSSLAIDSAGNLYIAEYSGFRIRKVNISTGLISTVAGTGAYGYNGDNILATNANLTECTGVAVDNNGNIYISDLGSQRIRKVNASNGMITTIAGTGTAGYNGDSISSISATINFPFGIAVNNSGDVYFADRSNNRIRKIESSSGNIYTVAGDGTLGTSLDGNLATNGPIDNPFSVAVDGSGNIYVAESQGNKIRKINTSGILSTAAGSGVFGFNGDGGNAISAELAYPRGIAVDDCGALYISDRNNYRVRKVSSFSLTISANNIQCNGACDGSITVNATSGSSPYSYSWSGGLGTSNIASNVCAGEYFLSVTDAGGCKEISFLNITQPLPITLSVTTTNANCQGDGGASAVAGGGVGGFSYAWSNGSNNASVTGLSAGTYTINVTDTNSCVASQTVTIQNNVSAFGSAPICMVTVDTNSQFNQILWDKTSYTNIDSFILYRETATNIYQRIGAQHFSSLSQFTDTVQSLYFPNTGNPNVGSYRYKIQMRDTCGNYSQLSPYHNTIFISCNNGTFSWPQLYTIENAPNPVLSYVLLRDNLSNGNWQVIGSVSGTQQSITDPSYSSYQVTATWRIQTQWSISCTPTNKVFQTSLTSVNTSLSNAFTNFTTSTSGTNLIEDIKLYPSVNDGLFYLESKFDLAYELYSNYGQLIDKGKLLKGKSLMNYSSLSKGPYFIRIGNENGFAVKRVIIN